MSDHLDDPARGGHETAIQDALIGARIVDMAVTVDPDGDIAVEWIAIRLKSGRYAQIRQPERDGEALFVAIDNDQHAITLRDFGGDA